MAAESPTTDPASLRGVVPPLLTPLTAEGDLDVSSLERLIEHHIDAGVDGLFVLGSSGEVAFFEDAMRDRVLREAVRIIGGRVSVLAGVIDTQTRRVIEHVKRAREIGVDAFVATAPFYAITGPEEVENHFRAIKQAAQLPVFAYDIPVCVHLKLGADILVRLGAEGVIDGVKDSSGDDVSFRRLVSLNKLAGAPLTLLTGHEMVVDGSYLAGADGSVPGLGNVDPAGYVRMDRAAQAGDWDTVQKEQDKLAALFEIVFQPVGKVGPAAGVGAFKTALWLMGILDTNTMSAPMTALEGENVDRIREVLTALDVDVVR
ncbi:dihydrodipicolinate synthase family protein [Brachybacterium epidermidis]|uniref:dihydrodipicolinate synthase family protein n=1 Tax=Brachybacterium epidermidis TaxID=2781983 RepID=UPI00398F1B01